MNAMQCNVTYSSDGLLGTTCGAVNNSMYAYQGSRNCLWLSEVSLRTILN